MKTYEVKITVNEDIGVVVKIPSEMEAPRALGLIRELTHIVKRNAIVPTGEKSTRTRRPWTDEDVKVITHGLKKNRKVKEIAKQLDRSSATVWAKIADLKKKGELK